MLLLQSNVQPPFKVLNLLSKFSTSALTSVSESHLSSEESCNSSTAEAVFESPDSLNRGCVSFGLLSGCVSMTTTVGEGTLRPLGYFDYIKREGMSSTSSSRNGAEKPDTTNEENGPAPDSQGESSAEKAKYNQLIDAFNLLQAKMAACGHSLDPKLPKIVVIGPENSGKTSVLQSFVGKDFLPSGSGLVTRRPTVIQFEPLPKGSVEYGVFAHMTQSNDNTETKIYDFAAIRQEILDETNRKLKPTEFSSEPIVLKIYSPNVLKLTLVDLPGMVQCE
ncbi:hypothetical protein JTE90_023763, partial [Oedothorax gibbosus]